MLDQREIPCQFRETLAPLDPAENAPLVPPRQPQWVGLTLRSETTHTLVPSAQLKPEILTRSKQGTYLVVQMVDPISQHRLPVSCRAREVVRPTKRIARDQASLAAAINHLRGTIPLMVALMP
jgi:hypothetical protein